MCQNVDGTRTGLADSHYKPTVEELLEEYLKAVDNLTINRTALQQAEIVRNQQALVSELRTKDQEMQQLKESNLVRDNTIQALQQELRSYHDITMKLADRTKELESSVKFFQKEVKKYATEFGARHLTKEELKKVRELQEQIAFMPDSIED
jgi:DNA repair exonuclease SbcCD ATPase subunit